MQTTFKAAANEDGGGPRSRGEIQGGGDVTFFDSHLVVVMALSTRTSSKQQGGQVEHFVAYGHVCGLHDFLNYI